MAEPSYILERFFGDSPQSMVSYTPHCTELGFIALHAGPGEATLRVPYRPDLVGDPSRGVVFGGVITTLLDHAGGIAVLCSLQELKSIATIDLRIDYMRPATPGRDLIGHAHCYHSTRNVGFVRGAAYHENPNDPFATFVSTYMLGANPTPPGVLDAMNEDELREAVALQDGGPGK